MSEVVARELISTEHDVDLIEHDAEVPVTAAFRPGRMFWVGAGWLAVVLVLAVLADVLPLADPLRSNPREAAAGPSLSHWFGTDTLGRDQFARVAFGGRISLLVAASSVALAATIGSTLGFVAGYARGRIGAVIMGALDVMLAFPALVLALALTAFLGASGRNVVLAVSFVAIPVFGRLARAQTLSYSQRDFVVASRASGATTARTLFSEVVPNVLPPIVAFALVFAAIAIVIEGGLSFLGLGVPPPQPSWGGIIAAGQPRLDRSPHISLIPAGFMFLTVLALNVVGEGFRAHFQRTDRSSA